MRAEGNRCASSNYFDVLVKPSNQIRPKVSLTTRAPDVRDNGAVSMLIWSAMKRAHELGLMFDLDGVTTVGTARFLNGFGGTVKTRLVITKGQPVYNIVQGLKMMLRGGRPVQSVFH